MLVWHIVYMNVPALHVGLQFDFLVFFETLQRNTQKDVDIHTHK